MTWVFVLPVLRISASIHSRSVGRVEVEDLVAVRSAMAREPMPEGTREFGKRVRARRHRLGKSQEQLAQESSVHGATSVR
jgi:ribosome-binding protein aMBF1 (putative translation factor)